MSTPFRPLKDMCNDAPLTSSVDENVNPPKLLYASDLGSRKVNHKAEITPRNQNLQTGHGFPFRD